MDPATIYIAVAVGAVALYAVLRPGRTSIRVGAALAGMVAFAWVLGNLPSLMLSDLASGDDSARPPMLFIIFSLIAVASAGRMITHPRPVYSALYFVLVVVSSAGLFLLLDAEFMAFALVIVYAGAILITYMFVIMLAQQANDPEHPEGQPEYDRIPREPMAAVAVGFLMLALLASNTTKLQTTLPDRPIGAAAVASAWDDLEDMPLRMERLITAHYQDRGEDVPEFELGWDRDGERENLYVSTSGEGASIKFTIADGEERSIGVDQDAIPGNVQRVGLALVADFPVSLELAGIILLMAMFGAVVMARRQIELGEDDMRQAAGLARSAHDARDTDADSGGAA